MDMKICVSCGIEKPLNEFYAHKRSPQGRTSKCKACEKQYQQDRYYDPEVKNYQGSYEAKYRWVRKEYKNNVEFKLIVNLRNRIHQYLIKNDNDRSIDFLGCSINEYKLYLESKFDKKMNWNNYGKNGYWEIDHIVPLSRGGSFHYTNTQPLPIKENRKKSNKLIN